MLKLVKLSDIAEFDSEIAIVGYTTSAKMILTFLYIVMLKKESCRKYVKLTSTISEDSLGSVASEELKSLINWLNFSIPYLLELTAGTFQNLRQNYNTRN